MPFFHQNGWHKIISAWEREKCFWVGEMYKREMNRARQQQTHMVPRLKEIHILRDSWTTLNVSPAKIMQVCIGNTAYECMMYCFLFAARASVDRVILTYTPGFSTC